MDLHFGYKKLMKAASILARKGTVFVATNTDEQFPSKSGKIVVPGKKFELVLNCSVSSISSI